jgi:hypothetical protein
VPLVIARLQQVQLVASEIDSKAKEIGSLYEVSLEGFSPLFYKLMTEYEREFDKYRLDEVVVAAIAPLVRLILPDVERDQLTTLLGAAYGVTMESVGESDCFHVRVPKLAARAAS